jgi:hypothetical protein
MWGTLQETQPTIVDRVHMCYICIHLDGMHLVRFASSKLIFFSVIDNQLSA